MIPISVIVPIYNMEKLMRKCLDSILSQTFTDYECLLIDDGSKDGSPAICDEYAAKDSRFNAYHKPNGGLSDARNHGLAHAQGEYTIFFDPDDWVDEDCLKDLYAKAQETDADMVMCDIYYNDPYRQRYSKQEPTSLNHIDVLRDILTDKVQGFTVIKLIRRELYDKYGLKYPKGMYGCEDQYTMCVLLKNDIRIAYLPKAYYHYMHYGNASQSRRYDESTFFHDVRIRDLFAELFEDVDLKELAFDRKTTDIIVRAFMYGMNAFSSVDFKRVFSGYNRFVDMVPDLHMKFFIYLSIKGYYQGARTIWGYMFGLKQYYKRLTAWLY